MGHYWTGRRPQKGPKAESQREIKNSLKKLEKLSRDFNRARFRRFLTAFESIRRGNHGSATQFFQQCITQCVARGDESSTELYQQLVQHCVHDQTDLVLAFRLALDIDKDYLIVHVCQKGYFKEGIDAGAALNKAGCESGMLVKASVVRIQLLRSGLTHLFLSEYQGDGQDENEA